ncbi:MAG: YbjQ family protein [Brachymonas sp.]|nr:YbjQ family protein [Brachymonas sp.]NJS36717.1 YbjQ family protein [Brachymonas sp.]
MLELIVNIILPALLLLVGYVVGQMLEKRHYASIRQRERQLKNIVALTTRFPPVGVSSERFTLVSGAVVVSSDYFKTFVAGFRNLFGGRFKGYESLLDRARREALLRLKEQAKAKGSSLVIGVRYETAQISGAGTPSMEVMAYGTALLPMATAGS